MQGPGTEEKSKKVGTAWGEKTQSQQQNMQNVDKQGTASGILRKVNININFIFF